MTRAGIIVLCGLAGFSFVVPPAAQAIQPQFANSASCVYDGMSQEEREIAIYLIGSDYAFTLQSGIASENQQEIVMLLDEALDRCLDRYPLWAARETSNATAYVMFALLRDTMADIMKIAGVRPEAADEYVRQNGASLAKIDSPEDVDSDGLKKFLVAAGWPDDKPELFELAKMHSAMSALMIRFHRDFGRRVAY